MTLRSPKLLAALMLALLLVTPGCALINLVVPSPTATPIARRALRPTFTPTPLQPTAAPPPAALAAAEPVQPPSPTTQPQQEAPLEQPTALPTATPTAMPTLAPTPTLEPPTPTPVPVVVVQGDRVRVRSGPGTTYEPQGELERDQVLTVVAKNEDGTWWQVCCLEGQQVWVLGDLVALQGQADAIAVAVDILPSPTPTATPVPKPFVVVDAPRVNVRTGPGTNFNLVGQVVRADQLEIIGRNQAADWWQVCCVNGQDVWITADLVRTTGPVETVALAANLPPTATGSTPSPVEVLSEGSLVPAPSEPGTTFALTERASFVFPGRNFFRVACKVRDAANNPLGGFYLRVENETTGQAWVSPQSGAIAWEYSAPSADFAEFREINVQFDTNGLSPLAGNSYAVWLVDGSGRQVSPRVLYQQEGSEYQWLYVVFTRE